MSDLPALHTQARRLVLSLRQGLERLEDAEGQGRNVAVKAQQLQTSLGDLERISAEMDGVWRMHVMRENPSNRDLWKRKVQLIAEDVDSIRASLQRFGAREQRRIRETEEREELLGRRREGAQVARQMDAESQMAKSVQNSKTVLEESFSMGTSILENMAKNRDVLKRAQRRALDIINTVGLSDSLLRVIERRQKGDVLLTYGGMVAVVLLVLLLWWFYL
ncbi:hypothetical protein BSKO_12813 [Bryopsis sp. KO-2023]|nr:hypothetical protein BSKO_12813 [Bryopsis sp. KO-2023]